MTNTKDINKAIVKEQFYLLGQVVNKAKAAGDTNLTRLAEIGKLSSDYSAAYIEAQKQAAQNEYKTKRAALYADAQKHLEKLQNALGELHSQLDFVDPALTNAVSLIKNVGSGLEFENILKINAQFAGNQPALRILQDAYKSAGVIANGGLDKQIYDPESAVRELGKYAQAALIGDGYSPFRLGVEIGKIAKLENVPFEQGDPFPSLANKPAPVDLGKVIEAARAGAGLPE